MSIFIWRQVIHWKAFKGNLLSIYKSKTARKKLVYSRFFDGPIKSNKDMVLSITLHTWSSKSWKSCCPEAKPRTQTRSHIFILSRPITLELLILFKLIENIKCKVLTQDKEMTGRLFHYLPKSQGKHLISWMRYHLVLFSWPRVLFIQYVQYCTIVPVLLNVVI